MKSFVAYPLEFETLLFPQKSASKTSGRLIAHYELFRKISHLNGFIVKCGITVDEGFARFSMFREMMGNKEEQRMIAFEKFEPTFQEVVTRDGEIAFELQEGRSASSTAERHRELIERGSIENVEFIPGDVADAIPNYLIQTPELKLALLNIDVDDYESTITALEFLYPRLMPGGVLIIDNFYKYLGEYKAIKDYFAPTEVVINNFSVSNGPHYIVKP
jgi:hypothetical protein